MHVNDIESAIECDLLYADDSALLISGKRIPAIGQKLSGEITKLNIWLVENKLSLHFGKTKSILSTYTRKLKQQQFLNIFYACIHV